MKKTTIIDVVLQMTNMYINNVVCGNGNEDFLAWLQDGEAFGTNVDEYMEVAETLAPYIDRLTWKIDELMK